MPYSATQIARVVHEANRALQQVHGDPLVPVSPSWDDETEETRGSVIAGVIGVMNGNTPEQSHESWCTYKREHGWVHGDRKDPVAKTHPCLVPYAELPERERYKDHLFVAIVEALSGPAAAVEDRPLRLDERHPSVAGVLRYLQVNPNLPPRLAAVSELFQALAVCLADLLPETPETTVALRKILEGKDAAVRAAL